MTRGKRTCLILKDIRKQIAEANDIEFVTSECPYRGECSGTCPRCEAEVRELEQKLDARIKAGKTVALAGISASMLSMLLAAPVSAEMPSKTDMIPIAQSSTDEEGLFNISGNIYGSWIEDSIVYPLEPLIGTSIINLRDNRFCAASDKEGRFRIKAKAGDTIQIAYVGYQTLYITAEAPTDSLNITLECTPEVLQYVESFTGAYPTRPKCPENAKPINVNIPKNN